MDGNNLSLACKQAGANKGTLGDGLILQIADGSYEPYPVERMEIPKLDDSKK